MDDQRDAGRGLRRSLAAAVRWRRRSGGWTYAALLLSWAGLTAALGAPWGAGWAWYLGSAALFVLLFEVGIAYVVAAAYGSHRQLEAEGEVLQERRGGKEG
jgi:hypothetical protein